MTGARTLAKNGIAAEAPALPTMEPALLAMLTGGLGSAETMEKIAARFGALYAETLPELLKAETGIEAGVSYLDCESGRMDDLVAGFGNGFALADAALHNWCPQFVIACGNGVLIALTELMLGAEADMLQPAPDRPLSDIELDLAAMVFEQVAAATGSGIDAGDDVAPVLERAQNGGEGARTDEAQQVEFATAIRMGLELGGVTAQFAVIVPQRTLLKTKLRLPRVKDEVAAARLEWTERMKQQTFRSEVALEARIRLEGQTLATISRLAAGDVIAFEERRDVTVEVSANGKDLYRCEFGRAGERYTVRVRDVVSNDDDIFRHLTA